MFKDNARKNPRCNSPSQSQMGKWTLFQASSHRRHFSLVGGVAKLTDGVARYTSKLGGLFEHFLNLSISNDNLHRNSIRSMIKFKSLIFEPCRSCFI